ncbi:MAG TPA: squalene synthase HpnC [Bacteroidota bacterium]|nr:squalene synthase HpnC [Bacteroidota bacterium]
MPEPSPYNARHADAAFEYCAKMTAAHYENFPVASLFLPAEKRPYIQAVYAFSRHADDFADEGDLPDADRLALLDDWENRLDGAYNGEADHPVFIALAETVRKNRIPKEYLTSLLSAFRQDVVKSRYATLDELLDYCTRSANPVGRIVLHIFGHREEDLGKMSDCVCTALQLTNFWQDLGTDRERDRLYLPADEMERFGYSERGWRAGLVDDRFRELMCSLVGMTRDLFDAGAALPDRVERDILLELRFVWLGGMSILREIEKSGYDVFTRRPALTRTGKIMVVARGFLMKDISRFGRPKKRKKAWDLT